VKNGVNYHPIFMLYLNEDVVNSQIKICTEREDLEGVKCPACCKVKSQKIHAH
jgi:hypothetical protein